MGREIRRVPKNWQHPKGKEGKHIPLFDQDYDVAAQGWVQELIDWENDKDGERSRIMKEYDYETLYWWDWSGGPPDKESYRPKFESEPTHYQVYENVSEGTPVSPVFETEEEMLTWLIERGFTEKAATHFIKSQYAPSGMFTPSTGLIPGIQAGDIDAVKSGEMSKDFLV